MNISNDEMIAKYPLCYAVGVDGNDLKEEELTNTMSINAKVSAKLNAGIQPTIFEERMCTIPDSLPGEIWKPIVDARDGKFVSNKRRVKNGSNILIQSRLGIIAISLRDRRESFNTNKMVLDYFDLTDIRFDEPLASSVNKLISGARLDSEDIINLHIDVPIPGEVWKPVVGYEGRYEVSNIGRVRSLVTNCILIWHITHGYARVKLRINDEEGMDAVHRLVATTFIPKTKEDVELGRNEVNHKDGNKLNNRVENLEWITHADNVLHALDTGLLPTRKLDHDLLAKAVHLYDVEKMEIKDIIALPEFVNIGATYMGMYKAIFRLRYTNFTDIPIPKARPTCVKGRARETHDVTAEQVIRIRLMRDRGFSYPMISDVVGIPMHVVSTIGVGRSKKNILNSDYPDLVAKIAAELDNQ